MAISALGSSALLQPNSSLDALISQNHGRQPQRLNQLSEDRSSARAGDDSYTPSYRSWTGPSSSALSNAAASSSSPSSSSPWSMAPVPLASTNLGGGSAATLPAATQSATLPTVDFYAGIPQSLAAGLATYQSQSQTVWQSLQQSLAAGDIGAAQTALTNYTQSLAASNDSMSTLTTPSNQFMTDLTNLGSALSTGDLQGAQSAFQTAQADQPPSLAQALATALATAAADGAQNGNWMQDMVNFAATLAPGSTAASGGAGGSGGATPDQFSTDLNNLEGLIQESNANVGNYLSTQGYTPGQVGADVGALNLSQSLGALPVVGQTIAQLDGNASSFTISSSIDLAEASRTGRSISGSALMATQTSTFSAAGPIDTAIAAASESINASSGRKSGAGTDGAGSASGNANLLAYDFSISSTSASSITDAAGAQTMRLVKTQDSYAFSEASLSANRSSSNPQNSPFVPGQDSGSGSIASAITEASFTSMTEIQTLMQASYGAANSSRNWDSASSGNPGSGSVSQYA
ncbi:MAG: hypothetical protein P4L26_15815 [Terracidiphilus sp.]|nr:hypothetical protein [Terracidiphilus sp.]